eukprot:TRINITY_DN11798_c0_g1_i1.p1 TRINITY_DN11798_c0_g1~~TRINITY_DN11798_c0_g1_i1.p1  ORF type:complete len:202 (+),score=-0.83 TRINITY_DN11798_c0_g1_i1:47-652(+)
MSLTVLLVLLCLFGCVFTDCGSKCNNNLDCDTYSCSRCSQGQCTRGFSCGQRCSIDTDCDLTSNCVSCIASSNKTGNSTCGAPCGSSCNKDAECIDSNCSSCIEGRCWKAGQCGIHSCHNNGECTKECSHCSSSNGELGVCLKGSSCSGPCIVDTDCDQLSNCNVCVSNRCTAGCGQYCTSSVQCLNPACSTCSSLNICTN